LQDDALTSKFLLELFHIRADYHDARDLHAEREAAVQQLQQEHAEGSTTAELEKQMAQLKKQRAGVKRKIDERNRARNERVHPRTVRSVDILRVGLCMTSYTPEP
jgi:cell division protein FtsB